ncbi:MAG: stage II sporulation protein P [Clostridia bacterium]|nr:stage II sporulation protein P [Clostridia bacterium]
MFNITVLRAKDLLKYFVILILAIILITFVIRIIPNFKFDFDFDLIHCLKTSSVIMDNDIFDNGNQANENKENIKAYKNDFFEEILRSQIGSIEDYENDSNTTLNNEIAQNSNNEETNNNQTTSNNQEGQAEETKLASTGLSTEIITPNPIPLSYSEEIGAVKIKNNTSHEVSNDILNSDISKDNRNVILFHTHTCESYTPSEKYYYEETGNFRTTDLNYTVARVGDELENHLKQYGFNVIHDKTYHDYPEYNGSYTRSLETVQNILEGNPTDIIFDVHRDAIGSRSDYAPSVRIGEDECAQIMFVIGSDEGGLWHPNWQQNLIFAAKVQAKAEEMYPGLFKPLLLTKYRYNQHAGKYASIIEVGATGNTLEQCNNSMKYLAKVIDEVMK